MAKEVEQRFRPLGELRPEVADLPFDSYAAHLAEVDPPEPHPDAVFADPPLDAPWSDPVTGDEVERGDTSLP